MKYSDRKNFFTKAIGNLREVLKLEVDETSLKLDPIIRDSAIKRFELCFELAWKLLQDFFKNEGIIARSPKSCFKEAFANGIIDDEELWLKMIDDRNLAIHTYDEDLAIELYGRLSNYLILFDELNNSLE